MPMPTPPPGAGVPHSAQAALPPLPGIPSERGPFSRWEPAAGGSQPAGSWHPKEPQRPEHIGVAAAPSHPQDPAPAAATPSSRSRPGPAPASGRSPARPQPTANPSGRLCLLPQHRPRQSVPPHRCLHHGPGIFPLLPPPGLSQCSTFPSSPSHLPCSHRPARAPAACATSPTAPRSPRLGELRQRLTQPRTARRTTLAARRLHEPGMLRPPPLLPEGAGCPLPGEAPRSLGKLSLRSLRKGLAKQIPGALPPSPPEMKSTRVSPRVTRVKASDIKGTAPELLSPLQPPQPAVLGLPPLKAQQPRRANGTQHAVLIFFYIFFPSFFFFKLSHELRSLGQIRARLCSGQHGADGGFAPHLAGGHPRNRGRKTFPVPLLPARCPALKEATRCPAAKTPAPSERAASVRPSLHLRNRNTAPPPPRGTWASLQRSRARDGCSHGEQLLHPEHHRGRGSRCRRSRSGRGFSRQGGLENSFQHRRDCKQSQDHMVHRISQNSRGWKGPLWVI